VLVFTWRSFLYKMPADHHCAVSVILPYFYICLVVTGMVYSSAVFIFFAILSLSVVRCLFLFTTNIIHKAQKKLTNKMTCTDVKKIKIK